MPTLYLGGILVVRLGVALKVFHLAILGNLDMIKIGKLDVVVLGLGPRQVRPGRAEPDGLAVVAVAGAGVAACSSTSWVAHTCGTSTTSALSEGISTVRTWGVFLLSSMQSCCTGRRVLHYGLLLPGWLVAVGSGGVGGCPVRRLGGWREGWFFVLYVCVRAAADGLPEKQKLVKRWGVGFVEWHTASGQDGVDRWGVNVRSMHS